MPYDLILPGDANKDEAEQWLRRLYREFGLGFHLDTPAGDYVDQNGDGLTEQQCKDLEDSIDRLFDLLPDPYIIASDEMEKMMG